jgi:hypothetical protein
MPEAAALLSSHYDKANPYPEPVRFHIHALQNLQFGIAAALAREEVRNYLPRPTTRRVQSETPEPDSRIPEPECEGPDEDCDSEDLTKKLRESSVHFLFSSS